MKRPLAFILLASAIFALSYSASPKKVKSVSLEEVSLPKTDEQVKSVRVSPKLVVEYQDGSVKEFPLSYKVVLRSGEEKGSVFGGFHDYLGNPIEVFGKKYSVMLDGTSLLRGKYVITHFEDTPGLMYITELDKNGNPINTKSIDFSKVGGTIVNCASSKTPWGTHLGAEEDYMLNSRYADKSSPYYVDCDANPKHGFCKYVEGMRLYLRDNSIDKNSGYNGDKFTPYNYGYLVEVAVNKDGTTRVAKHYVTGKCSPEMGVFMPDKRTLYITDDGDAKGLYKLVLDKPLKGFSDNWSGTLYMAKLTQLSDKNGGEFKVEWVELGRASDKRIKELINRKLQLSDIFFVGDPKNCPSDYRLIYEDGKPLCLKLRTGENRSSKFKDDEEVKIAAAFLETRKYGAYLGATSELVKAEGITYDPDRNVLYIAITEIAKSMADGKGDVRLPENRCGGIYELKLDSKYNGYYMRGILVGRPLKPGEPYSEEYYCDPNSIANPDNIAYIGRDLLLIGEDTTLHLVNMVWAYNLKTGKLTRIAYVPIGAEVTGVFARGKLQNGEYVLFMNVQHPYREKDVPINAEGKKVKEELFKLATEEDKKAILGFIKGIPAGLFPY